MNETMGSIIMRLRKENNLTQEQLGDLLGISYQAVSKWENGNSCPDISTLPLLADLFSVSMDELFGRSAPKAEPAQEEKEEAEEPCELGVKLPWPDDGMLRVVLFAGHELVGADEKGERLFSRKQVEFHYEGPALYIQSDFAVNCGDVQGNVTAGTSVRCGDVGGSVTAGSDVDCGTVTGGVYAGGDVDCG